VLRREYNKHLRTSHKQKPFVKLHKTWPARHQMLLIHLKSTRNNLSFVLANQFVSIFESQGMPQLIELPADVFLELHSKSWNHIEGGMELWKFAKHLHHAIIIFESVKARPKKNVAARLRITILQLMHVPQHDKMNAIHSADVRKRG